MNNRICLRTVIILTALLSNISSFAEMFSVDILTNRIHQRIARLNDNIIFINDHHADLTTRNQIMENCLTMFVNDSINSSDNCIPFIEYSLTGIKKKFKRTVNNYFQGLVNLRYKPVKIVGVNLLSSCNIYFDNSTSIVEPKTIDLELLKYNKDNLIILPCTVFHSNTEAYEQTELYLQVIGTIDGDELFPLITTLYAIDVNDER